MTIYYVGTKKYINASCSISNNEKFLLELKNI